MSDLISRAAAIDALADYIHNIDRAMGAGRLSEERCRILATRVLEELPSAQSTVGQVNHRTIVSEQAERREE